MRLDAELGDQALAWPPRWSARAPCRSTAPPVMPGRRAAGGLDRGAHRGVAGMGEALHRQRVEDRAGQRRVLQRGLERLALRPQRRVTRVGAAAAPSPAVLGRPAACPTVVGAAARLVAGLLAHPGDHLGHVVPADPAGELARVLVAQRRVLDLGDHRHAAAQRRHPALGVVQVVLGQRGADGELEQRRAAGHQIAQRPVTGASRRSQGSMPSAATATKLCPARFCSPANALSAAARPGRVAVEHVDQLAAKELVVHHQSAQHRQVLVAERGAARGDRGGHPGQVHRHHVGVALDDDGLMPLGDVALGQVDAEQHVGLLVQHRLGRVDVLGVHLVVVEDPARAEAR